jgi:zinc protease
MTIHKEIVELDVDLPAGISFVQEAGGIREYRLDENGLRILLMRQSAAPVATFMVTYHVGSRNETAGLTGATHFLEHLMFKGTRRFNAKDGTSIFNVLQRVGARVNATTWYDRTNYYEMLPREHLSLAIDVEADRMRNALIDEADVASERTVILNEMDRGENEPTAVLYHDVWSASFRSHPYHHPTIGWRSDVEGVTADGLRHFYDHYYWPNNATASVIGDFDPSTVLAQIAEVFGAIPRSPHEINLSVTREEPQHGERRVHVEKIGELGSVMVAYKMPSALELDTDALDVLMYVLGSGKDSRLYRSLTDRGLATSVYGTISRLHDPGLAYFLAFLTPDREHGEIEQTLIDETSRVADSGIDGRELERAKRQMRSASAFGRDGSFAVASQLNEAIAAGDWRLYADYLARISSVTADDIRRVAETYLTSRSRTIGWYIPRAEV